MSVSSRTPDDKLHRYLQRIQKLVGNRGRSPASLFKSRAKSPVNVRTPKLDKYLRYEILFKTLITFTDKYNKKMFTHFFSQLRLIESDQKQNMIRQMKNNVPILKINNKIINTKVDKSIQIRWIVKAIKGLLSRKIRVSFNQIRNFDTYSLSRDIKQSKKHRRTYTQIYTQTLAKSQYRTPSPIKPKQYTTPQHTDRIIDQPEKNNQVIDKIDQKIVKQRQNHNTARILALKLEKILTKLQYNIFNHIKSSYNNIILEDLQASQQKSKTKSNRIEKMQKIIDDLREQLRQKQSLLQHDRSNMMSFQFKMREQIQNFNKLELQSKFNKNQLSFLTKQFIKRKNILYKTQAFQYIKTFKQQRKNSQLVNILPKTIKNIFLINLRYSFHRLVLTYIPKNDVSIVSRNDRYQRQVSQVLSRMRTRSVHSVQHSASSIKSASSDFGVFAKKINKAFQLKHTLRQIYSYSFQKIDYAALLQLSFSKPLIKILNSRISQCFRKILLFSLHSNLDTIDDNNLLKSNQASQKRQKMQTIFRKIQNKFLFTKIYSYSLLKLNGQTLKRQKNVEQFIISQAKLKKQIKQFLQQRDKMQQKVLQSWQKTKNMLNQESLSQSKLSSYSKK